MEEQSHGCLKKTAIGCAALVVLAIAIPVMLAVMVLRPMTRAVDARQELDARFGPQDAYVPPLDGAPPADRVETFLSVRRNLTGPCEDLTGAELQVEKLESFDGHDEVDRIEVLKQAYSTTRSMMGVGPLIGRFYEIRNESLLEGGMGLGEFTYIFVVAYRDRLLEQPSPNNLFGPEIVNRRVCTILSTMLEAQLEAARAQGDDDAWLAELESEIEAMRADPRRIPWQDELPAAISEALAPYRAQLDELFCPAMSPLELLINEKRGPAVESL